MTFLNLGQHKSTDPDFGGCLGLEGLAYQWRCVHSPSGHDDLLVGFLCAHEGATTCSTVMKDPTNEWRQILDERGQRLLPDRGGLTFKMERRIQALALWSAFLTIENATEANLIYDLKHDDEP